MTCFIMFLFSPWKPILHSWNWVPDLINFAICSLSLRWYKRDCRCIYCTVPCNTLLISIINFAQFHLMKLCYTERNWNYISKIEFSTFNNYYIQRNTIPTCFIVFFYNIRMYPLWNRVVNIMKDISYLCKNIYRSIPPSQYYI